MRKLALLTTTTLMILLYSSNTDAQSTRAGIKGGLNFSNLFMENIDDENMRVGYHFGLFGQVISKSGGLGFQPELLYSTKGAKGHYNFANFNGTYKFNMDYVDMPLLVVFRLGDNIDINAGPYVSYLVNSSASSEGDFGNYDEEIDRDHFNTFDYGLSGGIAFNFQPLSFGVRYNYGLQKVAQSDIAKELLGNSKNGFGQVYAAFLFGN